MCFEIMNQMVRPLDREKRTPRKNKTTDLLFVKMSDYKSLPLLINPGNSDNNNSSHEFHTLYIKQHIKKAATSASSAAGSKNQKDEEKDSTTTLFVANIPLTISSVDLSQIFANCGPISDVEIFDLDQHSNQSTQIGSQRVAHVVFSNAKGLYNALNRLQSLVWNKTAHKVPILDASLAYSDLFLYPL